MGNRRAMAWIGAGDPSVSQDPMLAFEREAVANGFGRVAGVDEAGRGPLAGPIVAAAVILGEQVDGLNDSKLLTPATRERLFEVLESGPHAIGVHIVSASDIDAQGIQSANYGAMLGAAEGIVPAPDFLLVDGFAIRGCALPQKAVVKGDRRSFSIAAASIIAKVTRDRIMAELDAVHPEYGFAAHKGYGTRAHLDALRRLGPCSAHRMSFAPLAQPQETASLFQEQDLRT